MHDHKGAVEVVHSWESSALDYLDPAPCGIMAVSIKKSGGVLGPLRIPAELGVENFELFVPEALMPEHLGGIRLPQCLCAEEVMSTHSVPLFYFNLRLNVAARLEGWDARGSHRQVLARALAKRCPRFNPTTGQIGERLVHGAPLIQQSRRRRQTGRLVSAGARHRERLKVAAVVVPASS